jgi:lysophospholipase L1-like esterase
MSTSKPRFVQRSFYLIVLLSAATGLLSIMGDEHDAPSSRAFRFDAFGDSVTWGDRFAFAFDEGGRVRPTDRTFQGWPELLAEVLPAESGVPAYVNNLGHRGAVVRDIAAANPARLFNFDRPREDVLLLIGTNDSNPAIGTRSGLNCTDDTCDGSYAESMRRLVNNLLSNGRETIYVGLLPPVWGNNNREIFTDPLGEEATRIRLVQEYNNVISEEILGIPGVVRGPDFFSCFLTGDTNRFSMFKDVLHPNTLGQVFMAAAWRNAIAGEQTERQAGACQSPIYILESLDSYRHGHKQNLLAPGDPYYVDEDYVLVDVPQEIAAGVWVMQANADRDCEDEDFLAFDTGARPVTVYIAYDSSGLPPVSASHQFVPVRLSSALNVSDTAATGFEFVAASGVTGEVRIGGNKSAKSPAAQQSYIVIVVP